MKKYLLGFDQVLLFLMSPLKQEILKKYKSIYFRQTLPKLTVQGLTEISIYIVLTLPFLFLLLLPFNFFQTFVLEVTFHTNISSAHHSPPAFLKQLRRFMSNLLKSCFNYFPMRSIKINFKKAKDYFYFFLILFFYF